MSEHGFGDSRWCASAGSPVPSFQPRYQSPLRNLLHRESCVRESRADLQLFMLVSSHYCFMCDNVCDNAQRSSNDACELLSRAEEHLGLRVAATALFQPIRAVAIPSFRRRG
eukprot:629869-Rhodomonas_salina.1